MLARVTAVVLEQAPNERRWFVVETKPCKEQIAARHLGQKGIETFLPRIRYLHTTTCAPLFPGYLFASLWLEREYGAAAWTPGVKRLVAFGGEPAPVSRDVIAILQARAKPDGLIRSGLHPGERVSLRGGPLRGLCGIIDTPASPRGRVKVLMALLGRATLVDVPCELVRVA